MQKRTKFMIGVSLVVSAITTTVAFIALCIKKKNAWQALLAIAATEGLVGLALIEDKIPERITINRPKKVNVEETEEMFDDEDIDEALSTINAELSHTNDDEGANTSPRINTEIPRDDEASEADFI